MKDDKGIYYYPFPQNKRVRMYIRSSGNTVEFRMWHADDPALWDEHGWVAWEAIEQAIAMYSGKGFDPKQAYDIRVARAMINEEARETKK
ncbi:MAG: hypothetical protein K9K62_07165 [Desulfobacteraceae bacterium]|nr:hypothetical protein [Desulfobacteraceae bacterium]